MSSNSFLLCFISPFFIFTAPYLSLTKYFTTCYPPSYSAKISWSSVSNITTVYSWYICRFHLSCLQVTSCKTRLTNLFMMRLILVYWSWHSWPLLALTLWTCPRTNFSFSSYSLKLIKLVIKTFTLQLNQSRHLLKQKTSDSLHLESNYIYSWCINPYIISVSLPESNNSLEVPCFCKVSTTVCCSYRSRLWCSWDIYLQFFFCQTRAHDECL